MDTMTSGNRKYLFLIAGAAALGGLLFGYDTAVISGAIGFLQKHFHLDAAGTGWAASCALLGCIAGALCGGPLSDRFGRRSLLLACALLFAASGIVTAVAETLGQFVGARLLGGVAIGAVSVVSPLYIAEVAPGQVRGRLVTLYQLAIVTGILVVFFVNLLIQNAGDEAWNVAYGWRWMLGSLTVPAALFFFLALPIPESPRWLMKAGKEDAARRILEQVGGHAAADREMGEIEQALHDETGSIRELFAPGLRRALLIGIGLAAICQFSGINAILYYAPEIFKSSGIGQENAFAQTVILGMVNLIFTLVAIWLVDRAGRRALLVGGSAVQVVALILVGLAFALHRQGPFLLFPILAFIAAFAAGMGPVPWVVISEIFPTKIRGQAMSIATLVLWTSCYIVSQTFPILKEKIGSPDTFWLYAACSLAGLIFVVRIVPETKGRSLEEIEQSWRLPTHPVSAGREAAGAGGKH